MLVKQNLCNKYFISIGHYNNHYSMIVFLLNVCVVYLYFLIFFSMIQKQSDNSW